MIYVKCSEQEKLFIARKKHLVEDNKHIKYALANTIYIDSKNRHFAYAMENYPYKTLGESKIVNKKEVLLIVNQVINELLAINIVYWDIHDFNFLVSKNSVIVVDLDEAKMGIDGTRLKNTRYNYLNLVINLYLGYLLGDKIDYLSSFMMNVDPYKFFTKETSDYIIDISNCDGEQIDINPAFILTEFEDLERMNFLRRKMK